MKKASSKRNLIGRWWLGVLARTCDATGRGSRQEKERRDGDRKWKRIKNRKGRGEKVEKKRWRKKSKGTNKVK
jgi:hypothetical protein